MFGMTQDQFLSMTRQVLTVLGMLATTLGWLTPDKVGTWTSGILAVAGPAFVLGSTIWSLVANTHAAILTSAAQLKSATGAPIVTGITLNPTTPEAANLNQNTPAIVKPAA